MNFRFSVTLFLMLFSLCSTAAASKTYYTGVIECLGNKVPLAVSINKPSTNRQIEIVLNYLEDGKIHPAESLRMSIRPGETSYNFRGRKVDFGSFASEAEIILKPSMKFRLNGSLCQKDFQLKKDSDNFQETAFYQNFMKEYQKINGIWEGFFNGCAIGKGKYQILMGNFPFYVIQKKKSLTMIPKGGPSEVYGNGLMVFTSNAGESFTSRFKRMKRARSGFYNSFTVKDKVYQVTVDTLFDDGALEFSLKESMTKGYIRKGCKLTTPKKVNNYIHDNKNIFWDAYKKQKKINVVGPQFDIDISPKAVGTVDFNPVTKRNTMFHKTMFKYRLNGKVKYAFEGWSQIFGKYLTGYFNQRALGKKSANCRFTVPLHGKKTISIQCKKKSSIFSKLNEQQVSIRLGS